MVRVLLFNKPQSVLKQTITLFSFKQLAPIIKYLKKISLPTNMTCDNIYQLMRAFFYPAALLSCWNQKGQYRGQRDLQSRSSSDMQVIANCLQVISALGFLVRRRFGQYYEYRVQKLLFCLLLNRHQESSRIVSTYVIRSVDVSMLHWDLDPFIVRRGCSGSFKTSWSHFPRNSNS